MLATLAACCATPTHAVLFLATADPAQNTTAPAGRLADSGWQWQGLWGGFLGTVVHPKHFLTARHIGGQVGDPFEFRGQAHPTTAFRDVPGSDLRLWRVCGVFPDYAPLHTETNLTGLNLVYFGRGTQRGVEVLFTNLMSVEIRGWEWGLQDAVLRWGENQVEAVQVDDNVGPLIVARFDTNGLADECHLSAGDSGGAAFVRAGNQWELAGIHYAVDGPYSRTTNGPGFNAALFNHEGFFVESGSDWLPAVPELLPQAGALFLERRRPCELDPGRSRRGVATRRQSNPPTSRQRGRNLHRRSGGGGGLRRPDDPPAVTGWSRFLPTSQLRLNSGGGMDHRGSRLPIELRVPVIRRLP
jgi:hypothetical protein